MTPRRRKPVSPTEEERQTLRELERLKDCQEPASELHRALLWLTLRPGVRARLKLTRTPILTLQPSAILPLLHAFRAHEMGIDVWGLLGHEFAAERYFMDPSDEKKWQIHTTLLRGSTGSPGQEASDNLAFFRKELPKILRENPLALHSFRVRQRLLGALAASGVTRKDADRLFSALWRGVAYRKMNPEAYARVERTSDMFYRLRWDQETGKKAMKETEVVKECARRWGLTEAQVRGDIRLSRQLWVLPSQRRFVPRKPRR